MILMTGRIFYENIFIDDDFIANYSITVNSFPDHFETLVLEEAASPIAGARGKRMKLLVAAAPNVNSTSGAIWTISTADDLANMDNVFEDIQDNNRIESESDSIIDFTEINPFGEP